MFKTVHIRNIFFLLFVIYYAQGTLYSTGSIISQGALAFILIISFFYLIKAHVLEREKNTFFKMWTILLILNIVGFIFTGTMSNESHFNMFKGILVCSLPFYPFYYFTKKNALKAKHLVRFALIMLPLTILQYYSNELQVLADRTIESTNVVNNVAYSFVSLIPFAFLFKKNQQIFAYSYLIVLTFFVIQGAKRGALIAGAIGLICYAYYQLRAIKKKKRFQGYSLALLGFGFIGYYAYEVYLNNEYLISRMQSLSEGNTSYRSENYIAILNTWFESNSYLNLFLGFGFAGSIELTGQHFAHNDWLELLSNFGLIGVFVYAVLFYKAIGYVRYKGWDFDKRFLMLTIVLIWFFITLVSMFYTSVNGYMQTILLAYLIGSKKSFLV